MQGTNHNLIRPPHAEILIEGLREDNQEVTKIPLDEKCHYLPLEECEYLRRVLEAFIRKTEALRGS